MKIQITYDSQEGIEGFEIIELKYGLMGLQEVVDHSSEEIYIIDTLDRLPYEEGNNLLMLSAKKLRLNGTIKISGTDLNCLCKKATCNEIDSAAISALLERTSSLRNVSEVEAVLDKLNLKIQTLTIRGTTYEISAIRPNS